MEIITKCPICFNVQFHELIKAKDYFLSQETFHIVQCKKCSFVLTNPRPLESEMPKYYESKEYISHASNFLSFRNFIYAGVRNYSIKKKARLLDKNPNGKSILDIGCGTGEFISYCQKIGWDVTGLEPNTKARNYAKSKTRLEIFESKELITKRKRDFDVITMWHVLEHLHQLNDWMAVIYELLKPEGTVLIAVPNINSWDAKKFDKFWAGFDLPRHLYHFSKQTMGLLCDKHGFEIREIIPLKFDAFYISLLSETYIKGRTNYCSALFSGLRSNQFAKINNGEYSSLIFIVKVKKR